MLLCTAVFIALDSGSYPKSDVKTEKAIIMFVGLTAIYLF